MRYAVILLLLFTAEASAQDAYYNRRGEYVGKSETNPFNPRRTDYFDREHRYRGSSDDVQPRQGRSSERGDIRTPLERPSIRPECAYCSSRQR